MINKLIFFAVSLNCFHTASFNVNIGDNATHNRFYYGLKTLD